MGGKSGNHGLVKGTKASDLRQKVSIESLLGELPDPSHCAVRVLDIDSCIGVSDGRVFHWEFLFSTSTLREILR